MVIMIKTKGTTGKRQWWSSEVDAAGTEHDGVVCCLAKGDGEGDGRLRLSPCTG